MLNSNQNRDVSKSFLFADLNFHICDKHRLGCVLFIQSYNIDLIKICISEKCSGFERGIYKNYELSITKLIICKKNSFN